MLFIRIINLISQQKNKIQKKSINVIENTAKLLFTCHKNCLLRTEEDFYGKNYLCLFIVKSQVPKASSRDRLERVKAKLSVVTLLLPKLHLRPGLITHESDNDDDSGTEAKTADVIDKVAAAQKIFATSIDNSSRSSPVEKSNKSVGFRAATPPHGWRKGVVSAPEPSTRISTHERSNNLKNMLDSSRKISSEPGLISIIRDENTVEEEQLRKLSSSELPLRLKKRMTGNSSLLLPTVEEESKSSSQVINCSELVPIKP